MTRSVCSATVLTIWSPSRLCTMAGATFSSRSRRAASALRRLRAEPVDRGPALTSGRLDPVAKGLVVLCRASADPHRPDHRLGAGPYRGAAREEGEGRVAVDLDVATCLAQPGGQLLGRGQDPSRGVGL